MKGLQISSSPIVSSTSSTADLNSPTVPIGVSKAKFASVDGRLFKIDGRTQYFAGTNTWWLGYLTNNTDVDLVLQQITRAQLKVTRIWAFGNTDDASSNQGVYYQVLNFTGQYTDYDPTHGIARLDYAVSVAEQLGVKLVLVLLNNFDDLGGINSYTNAYGGDHNSFYTNPQAQTAYRNYISFFVNRYKASPAVFSWELCNEPRCRGCSTSVIYEWASSTSAFIKSLDDKHMVTLGDEGWFAPPYGDGLYAYSAFKGVDFIKIGNYQA